LSQEDFYTQEVRANEAAGIIKIWHFIANVLIPLGNNY